ncbi:hypothetical protein F2Q69_00015760 [Brassica cretica]|uniref:Uncharacterized protein n=2 Tax=Brassica cretica TaxID=69181 RepID=A0ABQ7DSD3_BRACR|nr:hypothetical protein F2Q69_00015760 [Brassica cretica]KAF3580216.1 hypothetical protein DY000_02033109 [Brassica cretica]
MYRVVDIVLVSRPAPAVIVGLQFIIATQNERVGKLLQSVLSVMVAIAAEGLEESVGWASVVV